MKKDYPWVTEDPVFMHLRYSDNESVKKAVDQCVETGFEKIILSFGSRFNIEDTSQANLDRHFLNGSSKTGMGYRETNWSLPR